LRKLGLFLRKNEVIEAMKEHGFRKISSKKINSAYIISGQRIVLNRKIRKWVFMDWNLVEASLIPICFESEAKRA